MKKFIIGLVISLTALFCIATAVYYNHWYVEKQWADWKVYGMDVKQKAYQKADANGWSEAQTEEYINAELDRRGIQKPGFCLYCYCWGIMHK